MKGMKREEAYRLAMRACEETWNEKICKQIEQALKQEPCEESISREDALMALTGEWTESTDELIHRFFRRIKKLPSVTSKQRTGHWIGFTHSAYHGVDEDGEPIWRKVIVYHCDKCNRRTVVKEKYCPNCGAKMVEPQESEDKE